ncbi:hypothetical protein N7527_007688 [Penicillium freii]|nr:hypothetical protein N7527_007688 [Penicillium freii]
MVNKGRSDHKPTNDSKVSVNVIRPPPRTIPRRDITDISSNFPVGAVQPKHPKLRTAQYRGASISSRKLG